MRALLTLPSEGSLGEQPGILRSTMHSNQRHQRKRLRPGYAVADEARHQPGLHPRSDRCRPASGRGHAGLALGRGAAGQRARPPRRRRQPPDAARHDFPDRIDDQARDRRRRDEPDGRGQAGAGRPGHEVVAGAVGHAGARHTGRSAGQDASGTSTDHRRRPDDPPQRAGVLLLCDRAIGEGVLAHLGSTEPGQLAGRGGRATSSASTRRPTDLQQRHRRVGHPA